MASKPLLRYRGFLTIPYTPVVTSFPLPFKTGLIPICFWAEIFIMKFIPRRIIPIISAMGVGISILGPSVNGKAITGTMKVDKVKILIAGLGILFTQFSSSGRLNTIIAIV